MERKKNFVVATHNGRFHADEVLALAILKKIFPDVKIIRSRTSEEYEKADLLVDVGGKYNPKKGFFDHHQADFKEKRGNNVPYASAGLVWKHFGMKLVDNDKEAWEYIDKKLVQAVDKVDTDSSLYAPDSVSLYTLDRLVGSFRTIWNSKDQNEERGFYRILEILEEVLGNEIVLAKSISAAKKLVISVIKEAEKEGREYIFISHPNIPFNDTCIKNSKSIKYAIYPYLAKWCAKAVTKTPFSYETRKPFPKSWRGLTGKELGKVSGISDADFCHRAGFIAGARSKEGIIKMVEKSLK